MPVSHGDPAGYGAAMTPDTKSEAFSRTVPMQGVRLLTADLPLRQRHEWLQEVIAREYAQVEVTPPRDGPLLNEMSIHPWDDLQLSMVRSSAITLNRLRREPYRDSQDAYFAVVLLEGEYCLAQDGREVFLRPGEMTLYDATRIHRVHCPRPFRKLIIAVPRPVLRSQVAGVEHCTAVPIAGTNGIGSVASDFLRTVAGQVTSLAASDFCALAGPALDLLGRAIAAARPAGAALARSRSVSINNIKAYLECRLGDPMLDSRSVARGVGLSSRYINSLFEEQGTSLMRYVWQRRLALIAKELLDPRSAGVRLADIAYRRGFNDLSHFSRAFKRRFGESPRIWREQHRTSGDLPEGLIDREGGDSRPQW